MNANDVAIDFIFNNRDGSDGEEGTYLCGVAACMGGDFADEVALAIQEYWSYYEGLQKVHKNLTGDYRLTKSDAQYTFYRKYKIILSNYQTGEEKIFITLHPETVDRIYAYFDRTKRFNCYSTRYE